MTLPTIRMTAINPDDETIFEMTFSLPQTYFQDSSRLINNPVNR